ncbi:uncharacterized protein [Cicer arietinum]|uniref:Uncharacterized protein LOC101509742 n=1 Tax=Cicer arietinum TaxID=3827 RepID=A0A1S2YAY0_CICAR|nr:uncharacterized protein LOC101509742 [Cicer arietinum]
MKVLLVSQCIWEIVEKSYEKPPDEESLSQKKKETLLKTKMKDQLVVTFIYQCLDDSMFVKVVDTTTLKEAWEIFEKSLQDIGKVKKMKLQSLRGDFEALKMKDSESILDYCSRVQTIVNQMNIYGDKIEDVCVEENFFCYLTSKFDYVMYLIEKSNDFDSMFIGELEGSLQAQEERTKKRQEESLEQVLEDRSFIEGC